MNGFKKILLILIFIGPTLMVFGHTVENRFKIRNVIIYGESNVMDFWLKYNGEAIENIYQNHEHNKPEHEDSDVFFELSVDDFIAPNQGIRSGFMSMLKSEENPNINIRLKEYLCDQIEEVSKRQFFEIMLEVGGVEGAVSMECIWEESEEYGSRIKGIGVIDLADFGLKAPSHFFGLIKVKETIMITFEVQVL